LVTGHDILSAFCIITSICTAQMPVLPPPEEAALARQYQHMQKQESGARSLEALGENQRGFWIPVPDSTSLRGIFD